MVIFWQNFLESLIVFWGKKFTKNDHSVEQKFLNFNRTPSFYLLRLGILKNEDLCSETKLALRTPSNIGILKLLKSLSRGCRNQKKLSDCESKSEDSSSQLQSAE